MAEAAEQITEDQQADNTANDGADDPAAKEAADALEASSAPVAGLMGWKPLDQWKGDPTNWKPAAAFLAEFPEVLRNTRKTAERVQGKLDRVVGEVAKLTKNQRTQADRDLVAELEAAVEAKDVDGALKVAQKLRDNAAPAGSDEVPAFTAFKERNAWFGSNEEATDYVIVLDRRYNVDGSGEKSPEAHFKRIDEAMKKRFPELYEAEGKTAEPAKKAPLVGLGGRNGASRSSGEVTAADLTRQQRQAADSMNVSYADYAKSVNDMNARERA